MNTNTKIIATVGPSCDNKEVLQSMIDSGVNTFRLNMSHGDEKSKRKLYDLIKSLKTKTGKRPAILTDLAGPKIRIVGLKEELVINENESIIVSNEPHFKEDHLKVTGGIHFSNMLSGAEVLIDDGRIKLEVSEVISKHTLKCKTVIGGEISNRKGVNFPGITLETPSLTEEDIIDLKMALEQGADWIALSFVRCADDVRAVHKVMDEHGKRMPVMAKIEKWESLENLEEITNAFDGIMVARGDLGVETPASKVPLAQKKIVDLASTMGKPVVIATQLLESMIDSKTPTRAEVSDIANAIFDGVDALLVTGETAIGKYPVDVIKILKQVIFETESATKFSDHLLSEKLNKTSDAISHAVCEIATNLNISIIMTMTHSGSTARMISKYRPKATIFALTPFNEIVRQLQLIWGVIPIKVDNYDSVEIIPELCTKVLKELGNTKTGDKFVITGGVPMGIKGTTNYLSVQTY
ncbi:MAG: pyruvate kinase [Candidatus Marinimicrobia bacterium]|nr:pyruvate kinase [Candidatus Neomarinimicrobiota bacterium]|tara:strand:- start:1451 stop:2854 length:1404 start_codon:yes stop_codon:yes gene_type:complete